MLRYYPGQDVLDVHRDRMSLRRLRVLLAGLPPECATRYAIAHEGDLADLRWRDETFLLAHLANMAHAQFRLDWSAASHGKSKPPRLDPILPPDELAAEQVKREEREMRTAIRLTELKRLGANTKRAKPLPEHLLKLAEKAQRKVSARRPLPEMTPRLRKLRELGAGARKATPAPQTDMKLRR